MPEVPRRVPLLPLEQFRQALLSAARPMSDAVMNHRADFARLHSSPSFQSDPPLGRASSPSARERPCALLPPPANPEPTPETAEQIRETAHAPPPSAAAITARAASTSPLR